MCFDAKTSFFAFIVAMSSCFYLWNRNRDSNDHFIATITFMFGLIQLNEFFLWLNPTSNNWNYFFSLTLFLIFYLFGLSLNMAYVSLYGSAFNKEYLYLFFVIYLFVTLLLMFEFYKKKLYSVPVSNCRMRWGVVTEYARELNVFMKTPIIHSLTLKFILSGLFIGFFSISLLLVLINVILSNNRLFLEYPVRYIYLIAVFALSSSYILVNDDGFLLTPSEIWKNGLFLTPSKIMEMGLLTPSKLIERFDLFGSLASFASCFVGLVAIVDPRS